MGTTKERGVIMGEKDRTWDLNVNLKDFPRETLMDIKNISDKHNGSREWLANVYYKNGKYVMGSPVMGDYSGVSMKPDEQSVKDSFYTGVKECMSSGTNKGTCMSIMNEQMKNGGQDIYGTDRKAFGVSPEDLVATIHLHPIRNLETPHNKQIRSQFSGTDIGSEFAKSVREDKNYRMFLTYPKTDGGKRHNMLKLITFPGKRSMQVMKASNPHLSEEQIMSITPDGENIELVDWYKYQDEAKKRGYIQEIDIESSTGTDAYRTYGNMYVGLIVVGVIATIGVVWYINNKRKKGK